MSIGGFAQSTNASKAKLSAFTKQYLATVKRQGDNSKLIPSYVYKKIDNSYYISAFIKVTKDIDEAKLSSLGIYIGTKAGNIWTAQIPVAQVEALTAVGGISYIDLDMPVFPLLDSARKETKADSAQMGIYLPSPMTGANVITGVIDAGFDFTHPTMYDTAYTTSRIQRVWLQKKPGTPPTGFSYGNELKTRASILTQGYDTAILSHGTHVTGIAAGSGYGSNSTNIKYRGMAYESNIVLVGIMPAPSEWEVAGESDIIDGMGYIFNYATSVGKPAVINLSWGSSIGPHDGLSLFSQACDSLTGAGKIFVCAAGNNGQDTIHLQKTFTATDTTVNTFVTFSPYLDSTHQQTWVDVWGDSGHVFCLNIKLYDTTTAIDSTGLVCLSDTVLYYYLIGSNGDTCFVTISQSLADVNGKPHAMVYIYSRVHDHVCLATTAYSGKVNMWEGYVLPPEGYYGYLKSLGYPWAVNGDVNYTVSDIGCTRSAITTGAYTSKTSFTNISGTGLYYPGAVHGAIAAFSSLGPTEDGRIKPDITAPGFALASAVSSFDTTYRPGGPNYISNVKSDTSAITGKVYYYAMLAGTSMASPCASGIVAMMLQLDPTMTPDSAKTIINLNAIQDSHTGSLPVSGTNTWGHGKINAYRSLRYMAGTLNVTSVNMTPLQCFIYPNPNRGSFTIEYTSTENEQIRIEISDITGKKVIEASWFVEKGENRKQISISDIPSGIYFTKVVSAIGYTVIKTIIE